ncbi:ATP-binding cassette sub-family C member 2 [Rhipicephalus sanguineus]|uniref:ATP-binding cassette sub-family C member 2 n=1 Tax=Rhipicephalus sanguineus TaxID=34632 RepID=UPI001894CCDC|nr:ATP-binding cassette sub-family C member 2 [Rhipicephalus sanguineus]
MDGEPKAQLVDVNLKVRPGSLVAIVGSVGSGKSSLLAAVLGDMHLIQGKVTCTGRVALSPQLPVVHNMTIRDNILYGKPMDVPLYHRVLRCCQLIDDLNRLEARDLTEVGEKGTNLSGGQKQRISIARAAYSQSDVYLLDDPLSALDPVVASRIFRNVIGNNGLLRHKTRIMVCNQRRYLHYMDKVIFLNNGNAETGWQLLLSLLKLVQWPAYLAKRLSRCLHDDMLRHVLQSPVSFFDESPRGRILNRFSTDLEYVDVRTFLNEKQSVQNTITTLSKAAVIGTQSPMLVGVAMVITAIIAFGMSVAVKVSHSARYHESLATSRLLQHTTETVDSLSSVRAYGVTEWFWRHCCRLVDDAMRGYLCFGVTFRFVRTLTATGGFVVVMCTLLANVLFPGPNGPDPSSLGLALSSACSADVPPSRRKTAAPLCEPSWPSQGSIEFQNFSSSYRPGLLPDVLSEVTFTIQPMEKVGVVGRTGAGKSSLVLALLRLLRPTKGHIVIDDVDISTVPLQTLRRSITVIPQDPSLVRGTLRMNLDPTNSHSDGDIWRALEHSHLAKFVLENPKGLQLETGDGGDNLSVGQRQLVCLARALLRKSKILLLDEATSQMDGDTDRLIQVTLKKAFANCTVVTVAHRIHTVLDCDRVLVLEDGRVQEFDSVQKLLGDSSSAFYSIAVEAGIHRTESERQRVITAL